MLTTITKTLPSNINKILESGKIEITPNLKKGSPINQKTKFKK